MRHILQNFFSSTTFWYCYVGSNSYTRSFSGWQRSKYHLMSSFRFSSNNFLSSLSVQGRLEPIVKTVSLQAVGLLSSSFKFPLLYEVTTGSNVGKCLNAMPCRRSTTCSCNVMDECTETLIIRILIVNIISSDYRNTDPGLVKWDLWWTKWRWGSFSPSTSVSPANLYSNKLSIIIITRGRYNRPFSGRRAEWTQFGLHPPLCELKKKLQANCLFTLPLSSGSTLRIQFISL
jgi:hypothetical protein